MLYKRFFLFPIFLPTTSGINNLYIQCQEQHQILSSEIRKFAVNQTTQNVLLYTYIVSNLSSSVNRGISKSLSLISTLNLLALPGSQHLISSPLCVLILPGFPACALCCHLLLQGMCSNVWTNDFLHFPLYIWAQNPTLPDL